MITFNALPASLSEDEFRQKLEALHGLSNEEAYASFDDETESSCLTIILSGVGERFATGTILKDAKCPTLLVQDPYAPWYTGSQICAGLDDIEQTIRTNFPKAQRFIFVGQSSGGYAALALSRRFENTVTIAFSPQTFDDRDVKRDNFTLPAEFNIVTTPCIEDVVDIYKKSKNRGQTYIIVPRSEAENPPQHYFWCDALHWVRMVGLPNVKVIMASSNTHPVLYRNTHGFRDALGHLACPYPDNHLFVQSLLNAASV